MKYTIFDASRGACNGKPKCARVVKRHSSGVKHFPSGVKKNLGGFNPPPNPPRKSAMDTGNVSSGNLDVEKMCVFLFAKHCAHFYIVPT